MDDSKKFPTQRQLVLPLLETLYEAGGAAAPRDVYRAVAERVGLPERLRTLTAPAVARGGAYRLWDRTVRFARQKAVADGLVESGVRDLWSLSERGRGGLTKIRPGYVVTVYENAHGEAQWAACESAVELIDDGSVSLLLTSPPYPLLRKKEYGNLDAAEHVKWLTELAAGWRAKLGARASLVLNMADVWRPGSPTLEPYQERLVLGLCDLGYKLCQKFFWHNPAKMPGPGEWVCVRRERCTPSVEQCWWLSTSERPKADNRRVLREYSAAMRQRIAAGGERGGERPSGHRLKAGAFATDQGGSIPGTCLVTPHTSSNDHYIRSCKQAGLPVHPARMPADLATFFVRLLTDENDLVWDPFGGSGTIADVCTRENRRWLTSEAVLEYTKGAALRLEADPSLRTYFDRIA